ncbi:hypothetical protein BC827DRAFT_1170318 [Russula dissimulans]|nr:hypothetical protein BC827DRAFT_1170318 [Russula dissimulans]
MSIPVLSMRVLSVSVIHLDSIVLVILCMLLACISSRVDLTVPINSTNGRSPDEAHPFRRLLPSRSHIGSNPKELHLDGSHPRTRPVYLLVETVLGQLAVHYQVVALPLLFDHLEWSCGRRPGGLGSVSLRASARASTVQSNVLSTT